MRVLAVDTETTGLDMDVDRITEIGFCLYDTETSVPLVIRSEFIRDHGMIIRPEITELTGITNEMTEEFGITLEACLNSLVECAKSAEAFVAHNAPYDRGMIEAAMKRLGMLPINLPWIDTSADIMYPKSVTVRKLSHLCAEHHFINFLPHRAISDVFAMLKVASHYDWDDMFEVSKSPTIVLEAIVQKPWIDNAPDGKKDANRAKDLGFRFDYKDKKWVKTLRTCHADMFREQLKEANLKALVVG